MTLNPGIGYTSTNLGGAYSFSVDQSIDWLNRNVGRQFECSLSGGTDGETQEYYLQVRKGLVEFDYYGTDENGILDLDNMGGFNGTNTQNMFFYMNKFNVFPSGKKVAGENTDSDYISDGYIKLDKEKNYFVFIYKTTPDWQQEGNLYEARAPQIGVAEDSSEPNIFIKTKRNGGGILQNYIRLNGSNTIDNIVTADPETSAIGTFNPAELNDFVTFNADLLEVIKDTDYPSGMETWLDGKIPAFAKPSTDPTDITGVDGMTIYGVPYGNGFTDYGNIGTVDVPSGGGDGIIVYYTVGDVPSGNGSSGNVIIGYPVGDLFGYTANPLVSGLIDPADFKISSPDFPAEQPVSFGEGAVDVIANNTTSITTIGEMTDEGVGYINTDCYRQDIAYIKWNEELNRFQIYQMQFGPIRLRQNPVGSLKNKILTSEGQEAKWDAGFDLCDDIIGSFSGYTKDLNQSTIATQPPSYAGYENIGNYQNPKETL